MDFFLGMIVATIAIYSYEKIKEYRREKVLSEETDARNKDNQK